MGENGLGSLPGWLKRRLVCGEGPRWWRRSLVAFLRAAAGLARESPAASGLALPGCASLPLPGRGLTRQRRERLVVLKAGMSTVASSSVQFGERNR
jgi:hypothetical protein